MVPRISFVLECPFLTVLLLFLDVCHTMQLPCGHEYCKSCMAQLREKRVAQTCPLCRKPLPPGPDKLDTCTHTWSAQKYMEKVVVSRKIITSRSCTTRRPLDRGIW